MTDLPTGWRPAQLGDVVQLKTGPFGSALHQSDYVLGGTPLINPTHIRGGCLAPDPSISTSSKKAAELKDFRLVTGDVVMGRRGEMGRCAVVPEAADGWLCGTGSVIVRPSAAVLPAFLQRFLSAPVTVAALVGDSVGSTMVNLNQKILLSLPFGLPPVAEQKRIADKLDTVLTRVDAVNTRLARVAPILKRFRQSVLAAATSGRLTEDWRGDGKLIYPTLPMAEIADMRLGKMLDKAKNTGVPVRYLRNVNVRWFEFDLSDVLELRVEAHERDGLSIRNGDLLVCEGGEPGRCAVWTGGVTDLIFQKALHRVRPYASVALSTWIAYVLKHLCDSGAVTAFFTGSTIKHLTGTALARVPIPVPNLDEQTEIVRRVETLFAFADRLEARLQTARTATERLTPTLLAKAFRGELVPQDPNDEPASELLKRLATSAPASPPKRGRPKARASG